MEAITTISHNKTVNLFLISSIAGILCLLFALAIPREDSTGFLFGYSFLRTLELIFLLLISLMSIFVFIHLWKRTSTGGKLVAGLRNFWANSNNIKFLKIGSFFVLGIFGFLILESAISSDRFLKGILLRIAPISLFVSLLSCKILWLFITSVSKDLFDKVFHYIFCVSLIWSGLTFIWFFLTVQNIDKFLIFKFIVVFSIFVSTNIIFYLDYHFVRNMISKWILTIAILVEITLLIWISNHFYQFDIKDILNVFISVSILTQIFVLITYIWEPKQKLTFNLNHSKKNFNLDVFTIFLSWIVTILILIELVIRIIHQFEIIQISRSFINFITLGGEKNFSAYFSTSLLIISAILLFYIFLLKRTEHEKFIHHWFILGLIFSLLALDEALSWHENLVGLIRQSFSFRGVFSYEWVIIAIPLVITIGIIFLVTRQF